MLLLTVYIAKIATVDVYSIDCYNVMVAPLAPI